MKNTIHANRRALGATEIVTQLLARRFERIRVLQTPARDVLNFVLVRRRGSEEP